MPQLDWTTYPSQLFWLLIIFFLLWGGITYGGLRPLQALFKKRKETLNTLLEEARVIQNRAEALEKESTAKLQTTRLACEHSLKEQLLAFQTTLKNAKKASAQETQLSLKEIDQKMALIKGEVLEDSQVWLPQLEDILLRKLQEMYQKDKA